MTAAVASEGKPKLELAPTVFWVLIGSIFMTIFLAAMDATIVASAEGAITSDLGQEQLLPWIGSAFLISSTVSAASSGNLANTFGLKWTFAGLNCLFLLGCVICGAANNMSMLIGNYLAVTVAVWTLSAVLGPLIGGAFADHGLWRWCFYINIPICAIATPVVIISLKDSETPIGTLREKFTELDFAGYAVVIVGLICLVTSMQQGGIAWGWGSAQIVVLLVLAVLSLVVFVVVEAKVSRNPMTPMEMFANRNANALFLIAFTAGAVYYALLYYLAIFFQINYGASGIIAGVQCIPFLFGLMIGSFAATRLLEKTGKFWHLMVVCAVMIIAFTVGVSFLDANSYLAERIFITFLLGLPIGVFVQNRMALLPKYMAPHLNNVATAFSQFLISLGGGIGVALVGAIQNNITSEHVAQSEFLLEELKSPIFANIDVTQLVEIREILAGLQNNTNASIALTQLIDSYNNGFSIAMRVVIVFGILALASVLVLKEESKSESIEKKHPEEVAFELAF
ncbi:hypothetical protein HK100_011803 [Physocladia obscura]|uniref:Major facilitator superfamily (MFS) profile domain-containing protein n=1 Tax=Physocladia obscura TaxID=109957 RepID=A0AAD5XGQ3_9FUNG|nr:hypothetical protein HK100_011803 [Physocladia obscura]